jgi:hypothetical protein
MRRLYLAMSHQRMMRVQTAACESFEANGGCGNDPARQRVAKRPRRAPGLSRLTRSGQQRSLPSPHARGRTNQGPPSKPCDHEKAGHEHTCPQDTPTCKICIYDRALGLRLEGNSLLSDFMLTDEASIHPQTLATDSLVAGIKHR